MTFNKNILIVAENASLKFGGEAALPLHYFRTLRKRNIEAYLIIHERTRQEIEALFSEDMDRIYFISDTAIHLFLWRCGKLLPARLSYFTFGVLLRLTTQLIQRRTIKQIIKEKQIDIIHQPTPVSPKEPSMTFGMGLPVIFGPMNGGMKYPPGFSYLDNAVASQSLKIGEMFADFINFLIPGKRKATTLLVANQRSKEALPNGISGKVIELIENGVDLSVWQSKSQSEITARRKHSSVNSLGRPQAYDSSTFRGNLETTRTKESCHKIDRSRKQDPVKFVFIGRLVDWKAVDLLLEAFKRVTEQLSVELEIIGDGIERNNLELKAQELGLIQAGKQTPNQTLNSTEHINRDWVNFAGWLAQDKCAERLQSADVLVLPSLFECGGAVVLEAMTMGLPVIATKWGGPIDYLDESCGILVEPKSQDLFVGGLTDAMLKLAKSEELRMAMGQAGYQKIIERFDWEKKLDKMIDIYEEAITRYQSTKQN